MLTNKQGNNVDINAAQNYGNKQIENSLQAAKIMAQMALILTNNLVKGITNIFKGKERKDSNLAADFMKQGLRNRAGNTIRAITRGIGGGNVAQKAKTAKKAKNLAKGAKIAQNATNVAQTTQTATNVAKTAKAARTARSIAQGGQLLGAIKTAASARKLATLGKIGLTVARGASLTNPVGIAVFAGTMLAPITIEKIFEGSKKLYEAKSSEDGLEIAKSSLEPETASKIAQVKQAQLGEKTDVKDLKIIGENGKVLLFSDNQGKVLINEFSPDMELNLLQQNSETGEKNIVFEENPSLPEIENNPEVMNASMNVDPSKAMNLAGDTIDSASILQQSLSNIQGNEEDRALGTELSEGVGNAKQLSVSRIGIKEALFQQNSAQAIFNLFHQRNPENNILETKEYTIERMGRNYSMRDLAGKEILNFTKNITGIEIGNFALGEQARKDVAILRDDLNSKQNLSGNFGIGREAQPMQNLAEFIEKIKPENIKNNFFLNRINSQDFSIHEVASGQPVFAQIGGQIMSNSMNPQEALSIKNTLIELDKADAGKVPTSEQQKDSQQER